MTDATYVPKVHMNGPDTLVVETGGKIQRTRTLLLPASKGHVGAGGSWAINADNSAATLAASQSGKTFVLPIDGLKIGDVISAFKVVAQVESAGGTVTIDADLRKVSNVAADPSDASLGAITQISVTADTAATASKTLETAETVATGSSYYILITATTGSSTDIQLLAAEVTVNEDA
jgi:hypothetical protein